MQYFETRPAGAEVFLLGPVRTRELRRDAGSCKMANVLPGIRNAARALICGLAGQQGTDRGEGGNS